MNPAINGNGNKIVYQLTNDHYEHSDLVLLDRQLGSSNIVNLHWLTAEPTKGKFDPVITYDGRYLVFDTSAVDLVPMDSDSQSDIYVYDTNFNEILETNLCTSGTYTQITALK